MTLERQHLEARQWLTRHKMGDAWLLYTPAKKLPTKLRKSLWQTEHGNEQRQLVDARNANLNTCIPPCL